MRFVVFCVTEIEKDRMKHYVPKVPNFRNVQSDLHFLKRH